MAGTRQQRPGRGRAPQRAACRPAPYMAHPCTPMGCRGPSCGRSTCAHALEGLHAEKDVCAAVGMHSLAAVPAGSVQAVQSPGCTRAGCWKPWPWWCVRAAHGAACSRLAADAWPVACGMCALPIICQHLHRASGRLPCRPSSLCPVSSLQRLQGMPGHPIQSTHACRGRPCPAPPAQLHRPAAQQ